MTISITICIMIFLIGFTLGVAFTEYHNNKDDSSIEASVEKKMQINLKDPHQQLDPSLLSYITETVKAPHNGRIYRIYKREGDLVQKGDRVLIYESCKMETEIKAPADGYVKYIIQSMNDGIAENEILFAITTMPI